MIADHDAAGDLPDLNCKEDSLRFEREFWVVLEERYFERDI